MNELQNAKRVQDEIAVENSAIMPVARTLLATIALAKFARPALHGVLASSLLLCGCPVRYDGPEPFGPQDVTKRQTAAGASMRTRSELHHLFGQPFLSSERRRVESFELSGEQIVQIGFPVVLGKERIPCRGYTLATYDNEQHVETADSGFSGASYYSDISLAAGDYQLSYRPGGHLKLPHLWPGQIPPPDRAGRRDSYTL